MEKYTAQVLLHGGRGKTQNICESGMVRQKIQCVVEQKRDVSLFEGEELDPGFFFRAVITGLLCGFSFVRANFRLVRDGFSGGGFFSLKGTSNERLWPDQYPGIKNCFPLESFKATNKPRNIFYAYTCT